jgi:ATP-dependent exoDNAse (exonuclease V) beta subunit
MSEFTWSYSSLKEYQNCPKKYYEIRVAKNYVFQDTPQTIYGKEVHKALEDYVRSNTELAKNYERYKEMVDNLIAIPGDKYCEYEMALTKEKTPCGFEDDNRWVRGICDLLIVDGDIAFVVDYKTGSNKYPDPKQLRLMALMTFAHFPQVNKVKAGLLFLAHNQFIPEEYKREDIDKSWGHFLGSLTRLDHSYNSNTWQPNPTPLCGYCPVKSCDFNKT